MESPTFVYAAEQVCQLLNIPNSCTVSVPEVSTLQPGEVLLWYPGCKLTQIRNSPLGKVRMRQDQDRYDEMNFSAAPGYYAVQLCFPDSNNKSWEDQQTLLKNEGVHHPAPTAVATLALLSHLNTTGKDLLLNDWCRCIETISPAFRVALSVRKGRVRLSYYWDADCYGSLWFATARKF